jgi:hypothetical protein
MIETIKDMKHGHHGHGRSGSYENLTLERTANQILHQMEAKDSEDSLESTRARVLCESVFIRPRSPSSGVSTNEHRQRTRERSTAPADFST